MTHNESEAVRGCQAQSDGGYPLHLCRRSCTCCTGTCCRGACCRGLIEGLAGTSISAAASLGTLVHSSGGRCPGCCRGLPCGLARSRRSRGRYGDVCAHRGESILSRLAALVAALPAALSRRKLLQNRGPSLLTTTDDSRARCDAAHLSCAATSRIGSTNSVAARLRAWHDKGQEGRMRRLSHPGR